MNLRMVLLILCTAGGILLLGLDWLDPAQPLRSNFAPWAGVFVSLNFVVAVTPRDLGIIIFGPIILVPTCFLMFCHWGFEAVVFSVLLVLGALVANFLFFIQGTQRRIETFYLHKKPIGFPDWMTRFSRWRHFLTVAEAEQVYTVVANTPLSTPDQLRDAVAEAMQYKRTHGMLPEKFLVVPVET